MIITVVARFQNKQTSESPAVGPVDRSRIRDLCRLIELTLPLDRRRRQQHRYVSCCLLWLFKGIPTTKSAQRLRRRRHWRTCVCSCLCDAVSFLTEQRTTLSLWLQPQPQSASQLRGYRTHAEIFVCHSSDIRRQSLRSDSNECVTTHERPR